MSPALFLHLAAVLIADAFYCSAVLCAGVTSWGALKRSNTKVRWRFPHRGEADLMLLSLSPATG